MTEFLRNIFIDVVGTARDEMSNNGCNDFCIKITDENRAGVIALCQEYADEQDELDSLLEQVEEGKVYLQDWIILDLLINRLKENNV